MVEVISPVREETVRGPQCAPPKDPNAKIEEGVTYESKEENAARVEREGENVARVSTTKKY